jgi:arabinan endo-1,5-alpha-L-arabinosidase
VVVFVLLAALSVFGQEPLTGSLGIHDPSTMIKSGSRYYIFATGNNITSKSSADKLNWSSGPTVFTSATRPTWTTNAVPGFGGNFWAPDIIFLNGIYYLYYSVSTFGSQTSAIGLVTNPTLDPTSTNYLWTDQGVVIQSNGGVNYNAIDPSVFLASDGRLWMTFGSFWDGIKMVQLDPATGKRSSTNLTVYSVARHAPSTAIEGSCLIQRSNYYYLFVNWDTCCSGLDSTYNIHVGRSTTVTGPFLDRNNISMASSGGSLFLEGTGRFIGPGHAGVFPEGETNWFTYHYYDGNANGTSKLALGRMQWSADGWPTLTNDWTAFYPFEADAREDRNLYNGQLQNSAVVVAESQRSRVLNLNGVNQYVTLPLSIANASTFAVWVKWNGGTAGQRIFDFGDGSTSYLFLSPSAGGNLRFRFAITTNGSGAERTIDGPSALPVNSWCHIAVVLDGSRGKLFLNGVPVATNSTVPVRPWQVQARTNYLGRSQFVTDPYFNGEIDSLRIFGRPLSDAEILQIAEAHPALSHRYSFAADARDPIGCAHAELKGAATTTNGMLVLDGVSGDYAQLPGGLVSQCSAASLEFWASFGVNGAWSRVFDFGNTNGVNGQNFLFFTPHTSVASHRLSLATSGGTRDEDVPGVLDNQILHVVCVVDPTTGFSAIYTNGVLENSMSGALALLTSVGNVYSFLGRSLFTADAWLNGNIDEFRIYHGRLTPEEIAADYLAGPDALAIPMTLATSSSVDGCTITWPSYAAGFVLETAPALDASATWTPVDITPSISNGMYGLTLPSSDTNAFFRLRR